MLRLLIVFAIIATGIIVGPMLAGNPGKISIEVAGYSIQASVVALGIILFLFLLVLATLYWLLKRILKAFSVTKRWFFDDNAIRAERMTQTALLRLIEGDYQYAEKLLKHSAKATSHPMANYLLAAESAHRRSDVQTAHRFLELASKHVDDDRLPIEITRIRLQLAQSQIKEANSSLQRLLSLHPKHPELMRLAQRIYLADENYEALGELLPVMRKISLFDDKKLNWLEEQTYLGLMKIESGKEHAVKELKLWWQTVPKTIRKMNHFNRSAIQIFIDIKDEETAAKLMILSLKNDYDEPIIELIPKLTHLSGSNLIELEKVLWKLLKKHGETHLLNHTLGQLLIQNGKWQSAHERLHLALQESPTAKDYALLADTYDHMKQNDDAEKMRKEALQLTLKQQSTPSDPAGKPF